MKIRIFCHANFRKNCSDELINKLIADFREYKSGNSQPVDLGRDVPFDLSRYTLDAGLRHIHIKDATSKHWHLKKITFHKTSDTALIYCEGSRHPDCFLLIAFVRNAHQYYREEKLALLAMADIAEDFRKSF